MAVRVIKNHTNENLSLSDIGETIPANGAKDIGGNESRLIELASSDHLLNALAQGTDKYQVNDGSRDLAMSEGVDLIRKIQKPTASDALGRWIVRVDSRRQNWDTIFQGAGDNLETQTVGAGTPFLYDFSATQSDPRWVTEGVPEGYKQQSLKWNFFDPVYVKEGSLYFFDMPKGSYIDFYVAVTQGYPYRKKGVNENYDVEGENMVCTVPYLRFAHWVVHYHVEGNAPHGDELNTESAAEMPAYPFHIFEAVITIPEVMGWNQAHGHFALELYRPRTVVL